MQCYYCGKFPDHNDVMVAKEKFLYNSEMEPYEVVVLDCCFECSEELNIQKSLH